MPLRYRESLKLERLSRRRWDRWGWLVQYVLDLLEDTLDVTMNESANRLEEMKLEQIVRRHHFFYSGYVRSQWHNPSSSGRERGMRDKSRMHSERIGRSQII